MWSLAFQGQAAGTAQIGSRSYCSRMSRSRTGSRISPQTLHPESVLEAQISTSRKFDPYSRRHNGHIQALVWRFCEVGIGSSANL